MANQEQLERLKQGVDGWNKWRKENLDIKIDLVETNLSGAYLVDADLRWVDLEGANLSGADLRRATLFGANLASANFRRANLRRAGFHRANFEGADLCRANLSQSILRMANLRGANLKGANLKGVHLGYTVLGNIDLSETKGLDEVIHGGSSQISSDTLQLSKGKIPEVFLRGCGLNDWEIESAKLYKPGLMAKEVNDIVYRIYDLRANQSIQINPLFISYSHKDGAFVDEIEKHLDEKSIRFWRDIHDAPAGPLEEIVDHAIRQNPTVLLVLSRRSVKSDWVQHEARKARELEIKLRRHVLCPVALDNSWKTCDWPERLREQIMEYNILDFSKWKDEGEFGKMFRKLIDGLDLFYKE
jgi:uncharacterized protein YjbI with pentapeptide repeats